jgi:RNA polymerase sigma factor (sigma-70 family)
MDQTAVLGRIEDQRLALAMEQERARLWSFIRRRVPDLADAQDILQDVFCELVAAARMLTPIEQVGAWLFRVARNRITDSFRKKRIGEEPVLEELLPSAEAGPEAVFARGVLMDVIGEALEELPAEQRAVFVAHEIDGRSFKDLAAETGVPVNTLLSRKRYAVLFLRQRLREVYDEFKEMR